MRISAATAVLTIFLAAVLALGTWRTRRPPNARSVERMGTGSIVLEGRIVNAPEIADTSISYSVGALSHSGARLEGKILVRDRRMWPRYTYGEIVRVTGRLETAEHEGYGKSLRTRGIYATMFGPRIESLTPAPLSAFGILIVIRETIEGRIRQLFPEPEASLAVGLLTGTRASFPPTLTVALRRSGLTHLTAVSGSNVAIVLVMLESMLFWLPRRWRLVPLVGGIALFGLFTGASASVVRACIMGGLSVFALHAGRMSQARRTMLWTLGAMLLWNPRLLTGDLGFQLSFLSVLGILEISPYLESFLKRVPNILALRESIALTLSSQIMAGPWIAYALGTFSIVSLPANLLAAPLVPWAMLTSAFATVFSLLGLGLPIAFIGRLPLQGIIAAAEVLASLPYASLDELAVPLWAIAAYYALLVGVLWILERRRNAVQATVPLNDAGSGIAPLDAATHAPRSAAICDASAKLMFRNNA